MRSTFPAIRQLGVAIAMFGAVACGSPDQDSGETEFDDTSPLTEKYSTLQTLQYSILREYDRAAQTQGSKIRYPICVAAEFQISESDRMNHLRIEQQAVDTWNNALRGQTGWRVDQIQLYLVGNASPSSCPDTDNGLKVYKLIGLANQNRGYAEYYNFKNAVGRSEWTTADVRRELHEYGHQLGLGDTYREAGYELPDGQPASVMNLYFNVQTLTRDDIAGIRQVWYMIRTNTTKPCGPGYGPGTASLNTHGHRFCVPLNGPPPQQPPVDDGTGAGTCTDRNTHCSAWAATGECKANPAYMNSNCCKACKSQPTTGSCSDTNTSCAAWAKNGECQRNPGYMLTQCCMSCRSSTDSSCTDTNTYCASWARSGECQRNPGYMLTQCCASCR